MENVAIVVVTFKRQELLRKLFDSYLQSTVAPWRIVVVDNENSQATADVVHVFEREANALWGLAAADGRGGKSRVVYCPQPENLGGSGGFSAGVKAAYELGAQWFWLMDDDVAIEPEGLARLSKWAERYKVVQGSRYDYDGGPFYWQYHFSIALGIYDPFAPAAFNFDGERPMNVACFEGGLFAREIVEKIGFPDNRFFLYWDDAMYGYRASKVCQPVVVPDFIMRRTREMKNWDIAGVRQLNSTSDNTRYYIMRNRGYMARYFKYYGDYRRFAFGLGTLLTFAKEFVRLVVVDREHIASGTKRLLAGWRDSRKILRDSEWQPMPALVDAASTPKAE